MGNGCSCPSDRKKDVKVCILEPVLIYPQSTGGGGSHGDHRLRSKRASVANIRVKKGPEIDQRIMIILQNFIGRST